MLLSLCVLASLSGYKHKENIKMTSHTINQLVFADSTTVESVEASVVFSLSDANAEGYSQLDNLETTIQTAISNASNVYIEEQEKKLEEEKQRQLEEERLRLLATQAKLSYNPFEKCNLTVEQYNKILKGTGLEGCGQSYYAMEETYGVNGLFAISVAFHESGYGKHRANTNNFYGMRGNNGWMSFSTPDANIQYFGKLMNKSLYFEKSIVDIGKIYCPGTYNSWASAVKSLMKESFNKI